MVDSAMTSEAQQFAADENYRLTSEEGHGVGTGSLPTGTVVTIVEVVPNGTPGVGATEDGSDVVLVSFEENDTTRTVSISASEFADLFTKDD